jgi:hypothetical protein
VSIRRLPQLYYRANKSFNSAALRNRASSASRNIRCSKQVTEIGLQAQSVDPTVKINQNRCTLRDDSVVHEIIRFFSIAV